MKTWDNSLETLILKWSIGFSFIGVTFLFLGKIVGLFVTYVKLKVSAVGELLADPEKIAEILWELIKNAI